MEELKCAIIAMARLENNYINEWIDWHLNLGFDAIIVVDDAREGEPKLKEVVNNDKVTIIEGRVLTDTQASIYTKLYKKYKDVYDWIAFIDIDEFINVDTNKFKTIKEFLNSNQKFKDVSSIWLYWLNNYGDSDLLKVENNDYSVVKRFVKPALYAEPLQCKNIYNTNKYNLENLKCIDTNANILIGIHRPIYDSKYKDILISVDSFGNDLGLARNIAEMDHFIRKQQKRILKSQIVLPCYINHYPTKTISEYMESKFLRLGPNALSNKDTYNNRIEKYRNLDKYFFKYNEKTPEKLAIYNEYLEKYKK